MSSRKTDFINLLVSLAAFGATIFLSRSKASIAADQLKADAKDAGKEPRGKMQKVYAFVLPAAAIIISAVTALGFQPKTVSVSIAAIILGIIAGCALHEFLRLKTFASCVLGALTAIVGLFIATTIDERFTVIVSPPADGGIWSDNVSLNFYFLNRSPEPWLVTQMAVARVLSKYPNDTVVGDKQQCRLQDLKIYLAMWNLFPPYVPSSPSVIDARPIAAYKPSNVVVDGAVAKTSALLVDPGKLRSATVSFAMQPPINTALFNRVVLCPIFGAAGVRTSTWGWNICQGAYSVRNGQTSQGRETGETSFCTMGWQAL